MIEKFDFLKTQQERFSPIGGSHCENLPFLNKYASWLQNIVWDHDPINFCK